MARPLRIEFPGACYHVMARGNGRQWLYKSDQELDLFTKILRETISKFHIALHAVVLMRNHYHLLLETSQPNLSAFLQRFNSEFARRLNHRLSRQGSVFRHHYKAILVEKDSYYQAVFRYICQNPVRAGLVPKAEMYPASSLAWFSKPDKKPLISWNDLHLSIPLSNNNIQRLIRACPSVS